MYLDLAGRRISYRVTGTGSRSLIFIPALGTTGEMWDEQLGALGPGFTAVTYSPAGHDANALYPRQPGLGEYATDLATLAAEIGMDSVHLVGLSMGGMIAQETAIAYPRLVASLTLASTTSVYPDSARQQMRARAEQVARDGMAGLAEDRLHAWFTPEFISRRPEAVDRVRGQLRTADPLAYAQAARAVADVNTTERLSAIRCPVLVLRGARDASLPSGAFELLVQGIPEAIGREIADAAHLCNVERAAQFNRHLLDFLTSMSGE